MSVAETTGLAEHGKESGHTAAPTDKAQDRALHPRRQRPCEQSARRSRHTGNGPRRGQQELHLRSPHRSSSPMGRKGGAHFFRNPHGIASRSRTHRLSLNHQGRAQEKRRGFRPWIIVQQARREPAEIGCSRLPWLRKQHALEDLIRFWLGHADKTVTDGYSKLKEDVTFRKKVAEQVGIGFELQTKSSKLHPIAPKASCCQSLRKELKLKRKNGSPS